VIFFEDYLQAIVEFEYHAFGSPFRIQELRLPTRWARESSGATGESRKDAAGNGRFHGATVARGKQVGCSSIYLTGDWLALARSPPVPPRFAQQSWAALAPRSE
jgi:hypothetical protein